MFNSDELAVLEALVPPSERDAYTEFAIGNGHLLDALQGLLDGSEQRQATTLWGGQEQLQLLLNVARERRLIVTAPRVVDGILRVRLRHPRTDAELMIACPDAGPNLVGLAGVGSLKG
jgi:hypothetical protein